MKTLLDLKTSSLTKMFNLFTLVFATSFASLCFGQDVLSTTPNEMLTAVKCSFPLFGQFTYEEAKEACAVRESSLGFFSSPSEENVVSRITEWENMPGFKDTGSTSRSFSPILHHGMWRNYRGRSLYTGNTVQEETSNKWTGQLWLGIVGANDQWVYDNPFLPGLPLFFNNFANGDASPKSQDQNCVVMRSDGWHPLNCSGVENKQQVKAGALCTKFARQPSGDPNNMCNVFLLPPSDNNVQLPISIIKAYHLVQGSFTFDEAFAKCEEIGGTMSTSRSKEEWEFINANVDFSLVSNKAWIGLVKDEARQSWKWIDEFPNAFNEPWLENEPSDISNCTSWQQRADNLMGWKVTNCAERMDVLCETFAFP